MKTRRKHKNLFQQVDPLSMYVRTTEPADSLLERWRRREHSPLGWRGSSRGRRSGCLTTSFQSGARLSILSRNSFRASNSMIFASSSLDTSASYSKTWKICSNMDHHLCNLYPDLCVALLYIEWVSSSLSSLHSTSLLWFPNTIQFYTLPSFTTLPLSLMPHNHHAVAVVPAPLTTLDVLNMRLRISPNQQEMSGLRDQEKTCAFLTETQPQSIAVDWLIVAIEAKAKLLYRKTSDSLFGWWIQQASQKKKSFSVLM